MNILTVYLLFAAEAIGFLALPAIVIGLVWFLFRDLVAELVDMIRAKRNRGT